MSLIQVGGTAPSGSAPQDFPLVNGVFDGANVRNMAGNAAGNPAVVGPTPSGSAITTNPILIAGSDGTNVQPLGVNPQSQLKVLTEGQKRTYTTTIRNFAPAATATDFINIAGSASTTVKILSIKITGTATANAVGEILLLKRSTANSSGSPSAATSVIHDTADVTAASNVINAYGANPTTGSLVGSIGSKLFILAKNDGSGLSIQPVEFVWTNKNDKAPTLHGVAQSISLNWNGASVPSGMVVDVEITHTEE